MFECTQEEMWPYSNPAVAESFAQAVALWESLCQSKPGSMIIKSAHTVAAFLLRENVLPNALPNHTE